MEANRRLALLMFLTLSLPALINAQITWSGIYDFEIRKGGKGSSLESNELPNDWLQLNVHNLQIFFDAALENGISFSGKIASSRRTAPDIRGIDVELAYVTFSRLVDNVLSISAGKILTPFGAFTRRQLSPDNPLPGNPMFFYYRTNVSAVSGYLDSSGVLLAQSLYGGRLSTIYSGGYYVGVEAFGSFADDLLQYDVAVMNAPLSSPNSGLNLDKQLSWQGRLGIHPVIWGTFGVSYSTGSYLERGTVNSFLDSTGGTERFKQETVGFDVNLNYLFYELNAEYIINRFSAPYIVYDFTITPPYRSGLSGTDERQDRCTLHSRLVSRRTFQHVGLWENQRPLFEFDNIWQGGFMGPGRPEICSCSWIQARQGHSHQDWLRMDEGGCNAAARSRCVCNTTV
ncbi:MAG: hypothetical protein HW374_1942, partial [Bacteroidetes bacterium]|nr:hypothetical protein [Bacteroidota bacterium]